jgi:hypothetical protein
MLKLNKGEPWVFWPSSICDTFPENPGNRVLRGDCYFEFDIRFTLREEPIERKTIFALLPKYTGLDIHPEGMVFAYTTEEETAYINLPSLIKVGEEVLLTVEHQPNRYLRIFINKELIEEVNLDNKVFGIDNSPHIIFGAGNFPKNDFNLNYVDLDLHEFILKGITGVICHHTFEEFIFDKSVDISGNLNFIHKL